MKTKVIFLFLCLSFSGNVIAQSSWSPGTNILYTTPNSTKVGIGTNSPAELLHINGGALKIGNSTLEIDRAKNLLKFGDGNYVQIGEWENDDMLSFKANRYNFTNGNVGIGTAAPSYKLDVNGTMKTTKLLITQPNAVTDWNTLWQSGFYDGSNAANAPGNADWYWGIHMGHRSNNSNYRYGGQIAISFNTQQMYFRSVDNNGQGKWNEVLTKNDKTLEHIESITLNPNDNFTYDGQSTGNYSFRWGSDSWTNEGPTLWISAWAGMKFFTERTPRISIMRNGNIGIGTTSPGVKLDVVGIIRAHEVKVCLNQGCDYVFAPDYNLMSLPELEQFVNTNRHLPEVTPAVEMEAEGIDLSKMNALLLKKVEELTLYVIELNKEIQKIKKENK